MASNISLGKIQIPVPQGRAGEVAVHCRFTYDINGILEVDLHVPKTGEKRQLVIVDDPEALTGEELAKRRDVLAALKMHPKDEDANRALMARIERCYEAALGERREEIGKWISMFGAILDSQDTRRIAEARARLTALLDEMDGETFL